MPSPSPHSASPSTPSPRSQLNTSSTKIPTKYSPQIVKRMQADECYVCHQIGHWSWDCPRRSNTSPNNNSNSNSNSNSNNSNKRISFSPKFASSSNPTKIYCRCGHGFCIVKTSSSAKNPGRKYYICPIERGKKCKDFVQFCDDPIKESFLQPPPYKYPECRCGAGVCEKVKDPDAVGKECFTCPIDKGHGKCDYKVSEDQLLHNNNSIVPIQQSSQEHNDELGDRGDLQVENSKRMRMIDSLETPLSMTASELPEGDNATPEAIPSRHVGFPEFQVDDDLHEVVNSVPWDAVERETVILSHRSKRRASCRQNLFGNSSFPDPFADASFGRCPRTWLGRLVFLRPAQSLKFADPQSIFCCIFPSFDLIAVPSPTQEITCDEQLAITNSLQSIHPSNGCHTELSGDVVGHTQVSRDVNVCPSQSQSSQRKPMSKAERERQMALTLQRFLLTDLENLDPHDKESMRTAAEDTFSLLNGLSVDYKLFSEHVHDFINHATSVADIDKSMENSLNFEECSRRVEEERARISQIQDSCAETEALMEATNRLRQRLREEVNHLEAMLDERRNQLESCEVESMKIETQLDDLKTRMVEANTALKGRTEEAELARRLNEEREAKNMAAKAALEKAKLELIN